MTLAHIEPAAAPATVEHYSLPDLMTLADRLNRTAWTPQALRGKPDEVLAVLMAGQEIGLPVMQSLQLIDNIQGRPTLNAQGQRAVILSHGHQLWVEEATDEKATVIGVRKGTDRELRATFTILEAQRMGLTSKDPWKKSPADMLVARATTRLARRAFADCLLGIAYEADEVDTAPSKPAVGAAPPAESPYISEANQAAMRAKITAAGLDVDAVIDRATGGRTSDVAEVLKTEVAAVRDAMAALAAPAADPETGEVLGAPPQRDVPDPPPDTVISKKDAVDLHRWIGGSGLPSELHDHVIANGTKGRTTSAAQVFTHERAGIKEGATKVAGFDDEARAAFRAEAETRWPHLFEAAEA